MKRIKKLAVLCLILIMLAVSGAKTVVVAEGKRKPDIVKVVEGGNSNDPQPSKTIIKG